MRKKFITYEMYGEYVNELTEQILNNNFLKTINAIYCPPRGGLPIGVHLSHHLNIPLHQNVNWFYFNKNQNELLIVDDIADTGKTLSDYHPFLIATLFYKPRSTVKPHFYIEEIPNDIWIVFPWETANEIPNRKA